eukprot:5640619-Amphidinium_carterae.1
MAPTSRLGWMTVPKPSQGRKGLVRPPLTPYLSPRHRPKKKAKMTERGTGSTGTAEWEKEESRRGRALCAESR